MDNYMFIYNFPPTSGLYKYFTYIIIYVHVHYIKYIALKIELMTVYYLDCVLVILNSSKLEGKELSF